MRRGNLHSVIGNRVCFKTRGVILCESRDVEKVQDAGGVSNMWGKENGGLGGKKGYIYSSAHDLIHILCFVGKWTQNGPAFILHNHKYLHEWGASRQDLVLAVRTVCNAGHCIGISFHFYCSDLLHLGANWVVLTLFQLCQHPTGLPMPSSRKSTRNWCHRIDNTSLFSVQCF